MRVLALRSILSGGLMVSFLKSYSSMRGYSMSFAAFFTCSTSLDALHVGGGHKLSGG